MKNGSFDLSDMLKERKEEMKRKGIIWCLLCCVLMGVNLLVLPVNAAEDGMEEDQINRTEHTSENAVDQTIQGAEGPTGENPGGDAASDSSVAGLFIDNRNVYAGMEKSYSKGYIPKIKKGKAIIVVPLQTKGKLDGNQIRTSLALGEADTIPFVQKNYEKNFKLKVHKVNGGNAECYLVTYSLELKKDRINGSYPVVLSVTAKDGAGNEIQQDFTLYVTITDGKILEDTQGTDSVGEESPQFVPKIMVQSYQFSKEPIQPGDTFKTDITLVNTSRTESVKNMTVTVNPDERISLLSQSDSVYAEAVGKGETFSVSYEFRVDAAAPQGQYNLVLSMDYADSKGNPCAVQGLVKVSVGQLVKMQFDPLNVPNEIQIGETVELTTQAMNLGRGKIYNVRAEVEAGGIKPAGTMFIGDIEAGEAVPGSVEVTAVGLTGNSLYGNTEGMVTFYYEDEAGQEMVETQTFVTSILSPLNESKGEEPEDDVGQWWVIMAVILCILIMAAARVIYRRIRLGTVEK